MSVIVTQDDLKIVWDPKNIKIKTWSVQKLLSPLINRVTAFMDSKPSNLKKGKSKSGDKLLNELLTAIDKFCHVGYEIASDYIVAKEEILESIEEIKTSGDRMLRSSANFIKEPYSPVLRSNVAEAARPLLFAVTSSLQNFKKISDENEFNASFNALAKQVMYLDNVLKRRQLDLLDEQEKQRIAFLRAGVKQNMRMLNVSAKVNICHPKVSNSKAIRDFATSEMSNSLHALIDVSCNGVSSKDYALHPENCSDVNALLERFDSDVKIDVACFNEARIRPKLEESLENIIRKVGLLIDFSHIRYERKHKIVQECNCLRQALQDLLAAYSEANNRSAHSQEIEAKVFSLYAKTNSLRKQLRKAAAEQVSDVMISTNQPLMTLCDSAKKGHLNQTNDCIAVFSRYVPSLTEVAQFTSALYSDVETTKFIPYIVQQLQLLSPQVINAAKILVCNVRSPAALELLDFCCCLWEKYFTLLNETIDEVSRIEDFMSVSESLILEDINDFIQAIDNCDVNALNKTSRFAVIRSLRMVSVICAEMNKYEECTYTHAVREAITLLKNEVVPNFIMRVRQTIEALSSTPPRDVDKNDIINASNILYDGIRDIRCAVLMNPDLDLPTDSEEEDDDVGIRYSTAPSVSASVNDVSPNDVLMNVGEHENFSREIMRKLPQEEMDQIEKHVQVLKKQKREFDREVLKWDEQGNEIIVLAKQMCVIMMEMSDFTRGKGSLRSTMDVIKAAKKISDCGAKLDVLARKIASECVESQSKQDLLAYLDRISLFTHQLNITSRVKADVQNISGELVVSGLDSATSLITAAKNLMNSVVSVVKASYIASTKYRSRNREGGIQWHMKPPAKKSLFVIERNQEPAAKIKPSDTYKESSQYSRIDLLINIR